MLEHSQPTSFVYVEEQVDRVRTTLCGTLWSGVRDVDRCRAALKLRCAHTGIGRSYFYYPFMPSWRSMAAVAVLRPFCGASMAEATRVA